MSREAKQQAFLRQRRAAERKKINSELLPLRSCIPTSFLSASTSSPHFFVSADLSQSYKAAIFSAPFSMRKKGLEWRSFFCVPECWGQLAWSIDRLQVNVKWWVFWLWVRWVCSPQYTRGRELKCKWKGPKVQTQKQICKLQGKRRKRKAIQNGSKAFSGAFAVSTILPFFRKMLKRKKKKERKCKKKKNAKKMPCSVTSRVVGYEKKTSFLLRQLKQRKNKKNVSSKKKETWIIHNPD